MKNRQCPFCGEKIKLAAVICRFCQRELPPSPPRKKHSVGLISVITAAALLVSGSAFLISEFLKERRYWLDG